MKDIVYLNGEFVALKKAKISVLDRGFLFGDSVYEVIPSVNGKLFHLPQHMRRLKHSLEATKIPMPDLNLEELLEKCRHKNKSVHDAVYLHITRGVDTARTLLPMKELTPTVFIACVSPLIHSLEESRRGIQVITTPDFRWHNCHVKATTLLPNVLARLSAKNHHTGEAIMIKDGLVTEGCASNVFIVKDGQIITPPLSANILGGITRDLVIELCDIHDLLCVEGKITKEDLETADEIWMTSSTRDISPVIVLNERPVGTGKAGPVWEQVMALLNDYKKNF